MKHNYIYTKQFAKRPSRWEEFRKSHKAELAKVDDLFKKYPQLKEDEELPNEVFDQFYEDLKAIFPDERDRAYVLYIIFGMSL